MKFTITHIHRNSATDRTHPVIRAGAALLSALVLATVTVPSVAALSYPQADGMTENIPSQTAEITVPATLVSSRGILSPADPESMAIGLVESFTLRNPHETPDQGENLTENNLKIDLITSQENKVLNSEKINLLAREKSCVEVQLFEGINKIFFWEINKLKPYTGSIVVRKE